MKINLIKLLCLGLALAMLVALVGCKNVDDTNNSSTPTSSAVDSEPTDDTASTEEDLDQETDETDEDEIEDMFYFSDGGYTELTPANATAIVRNYMNLQALHETSGGLVAGSLGIVDEFKIFEDEILKIGVSTYKKTNVKYADYKAKLLNYMSEKRFEEFWDVEEQKDGYIYISEGGLSGYYFSAFSGRFLNEENGVYTYLVTCQIDEMGGIGNCYIKANIIKENGMYVLDSYEYIQRKDILFKGYDKLNNDTASLIIDNYLDLKNLLHADVCMFIENLVGDVCEFDTEKTYKTNEGTLYKTNIKYKDFENAALEYMSKNRFKNDVMKDGFIVEKDGYLYTEAFGASGSGYDVLEVKLEKEKNGKYIYIAKCNVSWFEGIEEFKVKATIIKQNGVYVLDNIEEIEE